jgi:hypothetical protein
MAAADHGMRSAKNHYITKNIGTHHATTLIVNEQRPRTTTPGRNRQTRCHHRAPSRRDRPPQTIHRRPHPPHLRSHQRKARSRPAPTPPRRR